LRLNHQDLFSAYRRWKNWDKFAFGVFDLEEALYFGTELARSGIDVKSKPSVLEIGFGNGAFAGWAVAQNLSYVGIEADPELIARAKVAGFEAHLAGASLQDIANGRKFDVIVAIDVIEHNYLESIINLLTSLRDVTSPVGLFLGRLPSGDSPFSRAIQYGDITHKSVIGSGMIKQMAEQAGWTVVDIRSEALPVSGVGPLRAARRMLVLVVRAFVSWIVRVAFHDNMKSIISKNMVVVLKPAKG
jgi:cyclopropane fatty-acyl-phospholipid synthase-like methyltransferase